MMRIKTKETFEQTHKKHTSQENGRFVEFLKFTKNNTYEFYIVPKVVSIDLEADECEIDYPFEEVYSHFRMYDFLRNYANQRFGRINCTGNCPIDKWMSETKLPKNVFKIAVPSKLFTSYVIHDKKIKFAWFQDYLYSILMEKFSDLMSKKEINLIDAFRHKVKLFTNSEGKFDFEVCADVSIPIDNQGYKNILVAVNSKSLENVLQQSILSDNEFINTSLEYLKKYTYDQIEEEKIRERNNELETRTNDIVETLKSSNKYNTEKEETPPNDAFEDLDSAENLFGGPF